MRSFHILKSRKGQEGFTLIELLVVVLIIGILAAIAIPAFLGQKKGAQDSNAKSLLRNAAIAMESRFSDNQDFSGLTSANINNATTGMAAVEPNIEWTWAGGANDAKKNQVAVSITATSVDGYTLNTKSQSGTFFAWIRDSNAKTAKCKGGAAVAAAPANTAAVAACPASPWTTW